MAVASEHTSSQTLCNSNTSPKKKLQNRIDLVIQNKTTKSAQRPRFKKPMPNIAAISRRTQSCISKEPVIEVNVIRPSKSSTESYDDVPKIPCESSVIKSDTTESQIIGISRTSDISVGSLETFNRSSQNVENVSHCENSLHILQQNTGNSSDAGTVNVVTSPNNENQLDKSLQDIECSPDNKSSVSTCSQDSGILQDIKSSPEIQILQDKVPTVETLQNEVIVLDDVSMHSSPGSNENKALKLDRRANFKKFRPNIPATNRQKTCSSVLSNKSKRLCDPDLDQDCDSDLFRNSAVDKRHHRDTNTLVSKVKVKADNKAKGLKKRKDNKSEKDKMQIIDLIYWNPGDNPITPSENGASSQIPLENSDNGKDLVIEGDSDCTIVSTSAPKLIVDENGEILIDESSLVMRRNQESMRNSQSWREDSTSFQKCNGKHWTAEETAKFYKALLSVGADFSLMETLFPNRTRRELKLKFKREERQNPKLIDDALSQFQSFDINEFSEGDSFQVSDDNEK